MAVKSNNLNEYLTNFIRFVIAGNSNNSDNSLESINSKLVYKV